MLEFIPTDSYIFNTFTIKIRMSLSILINGDVIRVIAHLARLGLEQSLFLNEVDVVMHQFTQTGIEQFFSVLVVTTAKVIVAS